ncbi:Filamentous hemagglutinin-like protein [Trichormus variabilis ATCC 29413]|uniref:Filamentous hemagglutinin-like protein n=2 Tax=Anabaena variabilis TaxID=264691 RepID=Q3M5K6_TRIV2|nr:Filamentous hemagglutinin-like protein [Trichormus variabilis ATCC 29413]MBC1213538.1 S-layer family protein [Trichormus variabilis ARAD]MBC1256508.1 S-layer family protein [Trichormus variabilis V5]MBC1269670.1 S-layer family protein [Trichormus variabilis FSR]MBC1300384.1 S-layer family protein [Trichormus variabilis N2B]MBC1313988.1 S-layer family protein [Trichormus variabilis PNB]MBC1329416.1 S-layer family protein [Trichormus variabilis 9RC]MBD2381112.1 S-layer family protein [Trich
MFNLQTTKILFFFTLCLVLETPLKGLAQTQLNPDHTLPTNVNSIGGVYDITGGNRPNNGANLFHSFQDFSIQSGDTARFIYDTGISNIITRITGGSPSQINGTIQTLLNGTNNIGNANLFLINPHGIIFGANAKLDIGGSFIGTTADSIKFNDGKEFSAINPTVNPILTVNVPIGLQFGSHPTSTIQVQGSGNNFQLNPDLSVDNSNRPSGLSYQTPNAQTLALVAGKVELAGGNITVPQGRIELWSVNRGEVTITNPSGHLQLQPTPGISYGNVDLVNAASVDASGNSGGSIEVRGQNVTLDNGSVIVTDTTGSGSGGILNISASEVLTVKGFVLNPNNQISSGISADVASGASGEGGKVTVTTKTLQVSNGGQISSGTFGTGNAGELNVTAQDVQIRGISLFGPSGLFAPVAPGARGNGGNLTVETNKLQVTDGGQIFTNTLGFGKAGDLKILAQDVEVSGGTEFGPSTIAATVQKILSIPEPAATFLGAGFGNAGNLIIETSNLRVTDGGQIAVSTSGNGSAGNMTINANSVELAGTNQFGRSGLFANAIVGKGQGGDVNISSDRLVVRDGATINVSSFLSRDPGNLRGLAGKGAAGNINLNSADILLANQGIITADTNAGDKGNITIQSDTLQILRGSQISTNARNSAVGGNINITTNTLVAYENSDISANAQKGFGGRVVVNAKAVFGIQFRPQPTPDSDLTASSDLGAEFNGTVELNTLDVDPTSGLVKLPTNFSDRSQQIASGCSVTQKNRFVVSNRGGLPTNPTDTLRGEIVWYDVRDLSNEVANSTAGSNYQTVNNQEPIVEAQGLIVGADGTMQLLASIPQVTPLTPWQVSPSCDVKP